MIKGQEVWNIHVTKGMEMRTIGNHQVCTFSDMKNNYYEILEETAEKFPDKIGFSDNWNRAYTYGTFIGMVDDFAQWLTEKGLQRGQHVGMLLHNSIEFCTVFYAICKIRGGLACTVGADQRHDLAVRHFQRDSPQGLNTAVMNLEVFNFKHCQPPPDMRR